VPLGFFYVFFGIPMSWLADRANRRNILAISMAVWSGFTALCGLSRNYWQFLAARIGVHEGVWLCSRERIARHWIAQHPPV
jgi:MFS family permease